MAHPATTIGLLLLALLALSGCEGQGTGQNASEQLSSNPEPTTSQSTTDTTAAPEKTAVPEKATAQNWAEPKAKPEPVCVNCGTISAIEPVADMGKPSGIGVVAGGIFGGIIGNQIGDGSGQTIATVAGVVGGALAGNEVEKYVNAEMYYAITVEMNNGSRRTLKISNGQNLAVGQKVKVEGNDLYVM